MTRAGLKVSLFERGGHVLATVDDEIAARIHAELAANGIKLFTGADTRRLVSRLSHIFMDTINLPCLVAMIQVLSTNWNKTSFLLIIMSKYAKINQKISKRSQSNEKQGNNGA